jgi:hypothetical protein
MARSEQGKRGHRRIRSAAWGLAITVSAVAGGLLDRRFRLLDRLESLLRADRPYGAVDFHPGAVDVREEVVRQ